ncbi:unnamed protein product [Effrenium voratum]|nr:unnamed protein product [Effrenium voratum]
MRALLRLMPKASSASGASWTRTWTSQVNGESQPRSAAASAHAAGGKGWGKHLQARDLRPNPGPWERQEASARREGLPLSRIRSPGQARRASTSTRREVPEATRSSRDERLKHIGLNKDILACQSAEEILELCDHRLDEFNQINVVTAFHRIAKYEKARSEGETTESQRGAEFQ